MDNRVKKIFKIVESEGGGKKSEGGGKQILIKAITNVFDYTKKTDIKNMNSLELN